MSNEKVGDWLTILANVAVLLGLVVLIVEIRANTAAVRSQEWGSISEQNLMASEADLEASAIYMKALYSLPDLSDSELRYYANFLTMRIGVLNRAYIAYQNGLANADDWEFLLSQVTIFLGTKSGRIVWDHLRDDYADISGFVNEIDRALAESDVVPDDDWYIELRRKIEQDF